MTTLLAEYLLRSSDGRVDSRQRKKESMTDCIRGGYMPPEVLQPPLELASCRLGKLDGLLNYLRESVDVFDPFGSQKELSR